MSRIGTMSIPKDTAVTVVVNKTTVTVTGPKGILTMELPVGITVKEESQSFIVESVKKDKKANAKHGYVRANLSNMITGVSKGWTKTLELSGVGYRATLTGGALVLTVGFSHPVTITPPPGISFTVNEGKITVTGFDKQVVGQIAADIREVKKPEPYKGKGIRYVGEHVRKKAGKSAKAVGGAPGA